MTLAKHTRANREFFEPGCAPSKAQWVAWIERGAVKGKIIDGQPWVDLSWFAANDQMQPMPQAPHRVSGLDLLY